MMREYCRKVNLCEKFNTSLARLVFSVTSTYNAVFKFSLQMSNYLLAGFGFAHVNKSVLANLANYAIIRMYSK